jgi:hypothetical protein
MTAMLETPVEFVESLASMRFPAKTDRRLQELMNRNTNGDLTVSERDELESLAELSETMSLFRGRALHLLGRKPV